MDNNNRYILFMEKITRKLADTFLQINELCHQEMMVMESKNVVAENVDQNVNQPDINVELVQQEVQENDDSQEQEEIQKEIKENKTKKIKKENQTQEQKEAEDNRNKKKAKKLSHKPKAPASSFLIFFKEQQGNISRSYPLYGVTQLTKVAAKCWNELCHEEKQPYIKLGDQERKIYQEKMQKYRIEFPHEIAEKEKIRRQLKKQKEKEKKTNKESQTPKKEKEKEKPQIQQKVVLQPPEFKAPNKKPEQPQMILIESKQSQSNDDLDQDDDDSLGMV